MGAVIIELEHLGGDDDRLAGCSALAQDSPLNDRHLLWAHLHAEIAARDHQAIRQSHDLFEAIDGRGFFKLGHYGRAAVDQPAHLHHVFRPLHKGQRHPVGAHVGRKSEVDAVLFGQRRHRQQGADDADPLAVGERAAGDDLRVGEISPARLGHEADLAVVQQQLDAGFQRCEDFRMRHADPARIAGARVHVETERAPGRQSDLAFGKGPDAQLWALQVREHLDRPARFALHLTHDVVATLVIFMHAVAEVEAEDVGAGVEQGANGVRRRAGGSERRNDLCFAISFHGVCGPSAVPLYALIKIARKSLTFVSVGPVIT